MKKMILALMLALSFVVVGSAGSDQVYAQDEVILFDDELDPGTGGR